MPKQTFYITAACSALLGLLSFMLPGLLVCVLLTFFLLFLASKYTPEEDRRYILAIITIALITRVIALLGLQIFLATKYSIDLGDGFDNIIRGFRLGDYMAGKTDHRIFFGKYNTHGQTFFNAFFFALWGKDIIALKYTNIMFSLMTGYLAYDLTRRIYSNSAARIAVAIVLFWPTTFLWSITALKETQVIFAVLGMLWAAEMAFLRSGFRRRFLFLFLAVILGAYALSIRYLSMLPIIAVYFVFLLFYAVFKQLSVNIRFKWIPALIVILALYLVFRENVNQIVNRLYRTAIGYNVGFLNSGGHNFDLLSRAQRNYYTLPFFLSLCLEGSFHFLTEPLPWHIFSLKLLLMYPIVIFWNLMLVASVAGIMKVHRSSRAVYLVPILVFVGVYMVAFGITVANIGTVIRYRDTIMPIVAMLASGAIANPKTSGEDYVLKK